MNLDEARENVGCRVIYTPSCDCMAEAGVISSVGVRFVFVRYDGDTGTKATDPTSLRWEMPR